jgi:hypothetical protein
MQPGSEIPSVAAVRARLEAVGWSLAVETFAGPRGTVWEILGACGEAEIHASGLTPKAAWREADLQARARGLAGRPR